MHGRGRLDIRRWAVSTAGFGVNLSAIDRLIARRWFTLLEIAEQKHPDRRIPTEGMKQCTAPAADTQINQLFYTQSHQCVRATALRLRC